MSYVVTRVVLYFGKYNDDQHRPDQSEFWCQISFDAARGINVPEEFKLGNAGFMLKPTKGKNYTQWVDDAHAVSAIKFCRQPNSIAKRINDLCHDDRLAFEVPIDALHSKPTATDHIGLRELKFFVFTVEHEEYGFTTEEHVFGREYEKIDRNGDVITNKDGKTIVQTTTRFCYFTEIDGFGRESQLAAELRQWRVKETPAEMMARLTTMAKLAEMHQ